MRSTQLAGFAAGILAFALASPALADEMTGHGSWFLVGADYGRRVTTGIPGPTDQGSKDGMDHSKEKFDISQDSIALSFRGTIWTDTNVTVQGHRGGLHMNAAIGWLLADNYAEVANSKVERGSMDDGAGGLIFGFKTTYPWSIIETNSFRWGVGFGFGMLFEMGRTTPGETLFDLDANIGTVVDWNIGNIALSADYEYAPINYSMIDEHRIRGFFAYGPIGAGVELKIGRITEDSHYFQGGLTLGYHWSPGDD